MFISTGITQNGSKKIWLHPNLYSPGPPNVSSKPRTLQFHQSCVKVLGSGFFESPHKAFLFVGLECYNQSMKNTKHTLIFALASSFLLSSAASQAASPDKNLVLNGDFENVEDGQFSSWAIGAEDRGTVRISSSMRAGGDKALEIAPNKLNVPSPERPGVIQIVKVPANLKGKTLKLSGSLAARDGAKAAILFIGQGKNGKELSKVLWYSKGGSWTQNQAVLKVPSNGSLKTIAVICIAEGTKGTAFIDNINIRVDAAGSTVPPVEKPVEQVQTPATPTPAPQQSQPQPPPPPAASSKGKNLVANGDFEKASGDQPASWAVGAKDRGIVRLSSAVRADGKKSLEILPNELNVPSPQRPGVFQAVPVSADLQGKSLKLSGYLAERGGAKAAVLIVGLDKNGKELNKIAWYSKGNDWSRNEGVLKVPSDGSLKSIAVIAIAEGTEGTAFIDGLSIETDSTSSATAPVSNASGPKQETPGVNADADAIATAIAAKRNKNSQVVSFFGKVSAADENPYKINTYGWEDSPFVTPDDQKLYFMYTPSNFFPIFMNKGAPIVVGPDRPGHHTNGNPWDDSDIYVSTKNPDGSWGVPVNLNINTSSGECCMMTTNDDTVMYLQKTNLVGPGDKGDVFVSRKGVDGRWSKPESIGAPVNTEWNESNAHVTRGEKSLYFMSDRPGCSHGRDLYVSRRLPNGQWGEVENLGPKINAGREDQIWVNDEETVMYFGREESSEGTMFKSEFKNGEWTDPVPVTFGTSKPIGEISFSNDMKKAYFAVVEIGKKDIPLSVSELQSDGTWSEPVPLD